MLEGPLLHVCQYVLPNQLLFRDRFQVNYWGRKEDFLRFINSLTLAVPLRKDRYVLLP